MIQDALQAAIKERHEYVRHVFSSLINWFTIFLGWNYLVLGWFAASAGAMIAALGSIIGAWCLLAFFFYFAIKNL